MVLRMAKLSDDDDYDASDTSWNAPLPWSDFGNDHAYNGLRTRRLPPSLPTNLPKLRKQGQPTSIQRKEPATTQKATSSWSSCLG
ncbi:unnamed protein product [Protopolystoma xenopodis]|uniref:Uncharacterized protein n=1 Tax=Protopolystoma xenopodis TaxID=117903 RepID=A0A3S5A862_9PLAT|nr:unnamed protein product [Protopolystoma xenopodis]